MNTLLKAILKEAADLYALGADVIEKQGVQVILPAALQAVTDISGIAANTADAKNELQALLTNPAADADLLAYATGLVSGDSSKAQAIISASAKLALDISADVYTLVKAIQA